MKTQNWTSFSLKKRFRASVQEVYDAWTTQDGMEFWLVDEAAILNEQGRKREKGEYIRTGDQYRWNILDEERTEEGRILEVNGTNRIAFTFEGGTEVVVEIREDDGSAELELTQLNIPDNPNPGENIYIKGTRFWTFCLTNLKSVLEGGLDLRDSRMAL